MQANADAQNAAVRADDEAADHIPRSCRLDYCKIYAPTDGRHRGDSGVPGQLFVKQNDVPILIVINQVSPIFVDFSIPEQYFSAVSGFLARGSLRVEATPYGDTKVEVGALTFVDQHRRQHDGRRSS